MSAGLKVFISYSHKDEGFRVDLEEHLSLLRREGQLSTWHDRKIEPGKEWAKEIGEELEAADLILLLVSSSFLSSEYCYSVEMKRALERHETGLARVVPIVVRSCDWKGAPFGKIQALPRDGRPITKRRDRDDAWLDVAEGLRRVVEDLRNSSPNLGSSSVRPSSDDLASRLDTRPMPVAPAEPNIRRPHWQGKLIHSASVVVPLAARQRASAGLFVGVRNFQDSQFPTVIFAVDDAVEIAHVVVLELGLVDPAKTVLLISGEPQKGDSLAYLRALKDAGVTVDHPSAAAVYRQAHLLGGSTEKEGLFVISFSTHGFTDQGKALLAAAETLRRRPVRTSIYFDDVLDDIAASRAERRLVLVDACRERIDQTTRAAFAGDENAFTHVFNLTMNKARGCAILAGATAGGFAYDDKDRMNGVFSAALIDGLRGEATTSDGLITIESLAEFADARVRHWVKLNRSEHMHKSLGISASYDPEEIRRLPLAIHPGKVKDHFRLESRRAVSHLVSLVDTNEQLFKDATQMLSVESPTQVHYELIEKIRAFEGTELQRSSLAAFLFDKTGNSPRAQVNKFPLQRPRWATEVGESQRTGLWASIEVGKVAHRLLWIEHGATTRGFWVSAKPCTEELLLEMIPKPERYTRLFRENRVGLPWPGVLRFLGALNQRLPGLEARVPTKAQLAQAGRKKWLEIEMDREWSLDGFDEEDPLGDQLLDHPFRIVSAGD